MGGAPIDALLDAIKRFGGGDLNIRATVYADYEVGELARSFNDMAQFHAPAIEAERSPSEQLRLAASVFSTTRSDFGITRNLGPAAEEMGLHFVVEGILQ